MKAGDRVKVITKEKVFEGILMPTEASSIFIKLDNGYNVGVDKKNIKKIEKIKGEEKIEIKYRKKFIKKKGLPNITILHTGGTIASKVDYSTGGVFASFGVDDFIGMFPEIKNIANISSNLISNMMSEDMRFSHYKKMAEAMVREIKNDADGIIIGHGTDTMAVTSAALSFVFENLPIPVILVGSQRSSDRGSSDSAINLICAAEFIAKTDFCGVAICMHESSDDKSCLIMPACKTRKMHTSRRDAFKVINDKPIARVDYKTRKIEFFKKYAKKADKLIVKDKFEDKVSIIKTYPNMLPDLIEVLINKKYKGLVLEATGIGQAPTNIKENIPNYNALKKFIDSGGVVVLTSQCIFGKVHSDIYTNCRRLEDIGVIFGEDMLTETAFVKLSWLLGNYKKEDVKKLIKKNLRGEINDRIGKDMDIRAGK